MCERLLYHKTLWPTFYNLSMTHTVWVILYDSYILLILLRASHQNFQNPSDSPSTLPKDKNKKKAIINRAKDKLKIWRHKSRESSTKNNLSSQGKKSTVCTFQQAILNNFESSSTDRELISIGKTRIPTVKLKIPGKAFLKSESRTSVTFKL